MKTKLVIFDLDGTLLDTIGDLAVACNSALAIRGLKQHSYEEYCTMVGNGIAKLCERALPEALRSPFNTESLKRDFVDYYRRNIATYTKPYDGIMELLAELDSRGVKLAVASNKFHDGAVELVEKFFGDHKFVAVFGNRDNVALKPDPQIVYDILEIAKLKKSEVLYVGDSGVDMQTATNANVRSVGVSWGLRSREELAQNGACHIIDSPAELLDLL